MEQIIEIPHNQVVMSFVATCIETIARQFNQPYREVYNRMKKVNLIEKFILPHYDLLHTESRENVALVVMECLKNWENAKG